MAARCKFHEASLDDTIRDRLVCGLLSETTQRRLLTEKTLTLQSAIDTAIAAESVDKSTKSFKEPGPAVNAVSFSKHSKSDSVSCYRCGRKNHEPKNCRFRNENCYRCGKRGHISSVCRASGRDLEETTTSQPQRSRERQQRRSNQRHVRHVAFERRNDSTDSDSDDLKIKQVFVIGAKSSDPFEVEMYLNDKPIRMEVDTGAAVSIISRSQQRQLLPNVPVLSSNIRLKTYTGERIDVIGELMVNISHHQQSESLPLIVVDEEGPPLIGRNWLRRINLDWKTIGVLRKTKSSSEQSLENLLSKHAQLFQDELGTIKSAQAKLYLKPDTKPKFFKPRPVPFALKTAVEQELDRLESAGIIQSVPTSEWAAPIVVVPKKDGQIRLCGDYKVTCNPDLDVEQYPLPQRSRERQQRRSNQRHVRHVAFERRNDSTDSDSDDLKIKQVFVIGAKSSDPFEVEMYLNDKPIRMEVDTGAAVSIISRSQQRQLLPNVPVLSSNIRLKTYTGERIDVIGELMVNISHHQQSESLPLIVVDEEGPPLIGRNWLRRINLDWKTIGVLRKTKSSSEQSLENLLSKHAQLFQDELGTIKSAQAKLYLKPDTKPKFFKPRPVASTKGTL